MQDAMVFKRFANVWTKLRAFELIEYDRVVLVDSDMLVRQNMDELMDWPLDTSAQPTIAAGFACTCNPNRIATYPDDWCVVLCLQQDTRELCLFLTAAPGQSLRSPLYYERLAAHAPPPKQRPRGTRAVTEAGRVYSHLP